MLVYSLLSTVFLLFVISVYYVGRSNSVKNITIIVYYRLSTVNKDDLNLRLRIIMISVDKTMRSYMMNLDCERQPHTSKCVM